jgi:hypothetical protein
MAHQYMLIDEAMTGFFENRVGLTAPEQPAGSEAIASEEAGPGELTQEQVATLRRLTEEMDYSTLHQGYTDLNRWLAGHNWLAVIKHGIQRTDSAVDTYFQSVAGAGVRPDSGALPRLNLASKMVGNKGRIDKIMLAVYALQSVEGTEDVARFDAFLNYWENEGWGNLMTFYDEFRGEQPRIEMSVDQYLGEGTSNQRRVEIGIQVGRVLELQPDVRLSVVRASVRETLDIAGTLAFFAIEQVFLKRIPGWAWIKLTGQGVIAVVNAFSE